MAGVITKKQRAHRIGNVLSFIFLFRFVTVKHLNLFSATRLDVNDIRRTIEYLVNHKLIKGFKISNPVKTTGYYLLDRGLARLPDSLLQYKYSFWPVRFRLGTFEHDKGLVEAFIWIQKAATKGYWISEWMIRQDKVKASGKTGMGLGVHQRSVLRGRMPDGMFVVGQKVRIAVEFEDTRRNVTAWAELVRDLEYRMKASKKIDPGTSDIVTGRDFEAVLFVFKDKQTFSIYRKRFNSCLESGKVGGQKIKETNPHRFFFATLDHLKEAKVYGAGLEETTLKDLFSFVENDGVLLRAIPSPGIKPPAPEGDQYKLSF